ncbi:MAG TPA: EAL domain-containing protein [Burkholderiaceae bacterium]|nr:EAL domain-containing protein [Burkholderiaceae bacterium]
MSKVPRQADAEPARGRRRKAEGEQAAQSAATLHDIAERRRTEAARATHLRFVESLDRVNSALRGCDGLQRTMSDVLDCALSIFDCDRAWLVFPCNPEAATWRAPMERTRPQYPGALALGVDQPVDAEIVESFRILRAAPGPLKFGPGADYPLAEEVSKRFEVRSMIAMVLYPKVGEPWLFGLHQCSHARQWTAEDERLFQEVGRRLADGLTMLLTLRDLQMRETESRSLANTQTRLNRSLRLLSRCNRLLIHADDESTLLNEVCRLVVEAGQYSLAWVSLAEHDARKSIRPIAQFGDNAGYLDSIDLTWADEERGRGPTGTAIRTGQVQICQNLLNDPRMTRWRQTMQKHGFRGSAALPLNDTWGTFGALSIYAAEPDAFIPEEIELLQELASNLAYGIRALRTRAEHRAAEEKLAFLAHHDPLTQLPNRLLLRDRFERAIAQTTRQRGRIAMMFLDLDSFKEINDSLGHEVGDELLIQVAGRLRSCVRHMDTVSREGGDEFVIVLNGADELAGVARVAQQILASMELPFEIDGSSLHTTLSIGISVFPDDGEDFDTLRRNSDAALFVAKDSGRNVYRFFDEQMNRDVLERLQMQASLRCALKNEEFRLYYQPQLRLRDGRIIGMEALVRWQRADGRLVQPGEFIAVAEQSGLIIPIGQWVLNEACRQAMQWRQAGLPELVVAVNLSVAQFRRGNIPEAVKAALQRSGLPPASLELELTESVLLHDTETALETLRALKKIGVKLSIDDFGTGYCSLAYLKRLAVNKLKIDRSFMRELAESAEDAAIVRAIIQLGHTLELEVVAEGVETDAQLAFLRANGCDQIQGYLISHPLPPAQFPGLFAPGESDSTG